MSALWIFHVLFLTIINSNISYSEGNSNKSDPAKKDSTSASVKFAEPSECNDGEDGSMNESTNIVDLNKLTNKKKQYLQDAIIDKNGAYTYLDDPVEYKKARKRLQNRESAVRSRHRKKTYQETLEQRIEQLTKENEELKGKNKQF